MQHGFMDQQHLYLYETDSAERIREASRAQLAKDAISIRLNAFRQRWQARIADWIEHLQRAFSTPDPEPQRRRFDQQAHDF
jgi:hypothetical protein